MPLYTYKAVDPQGKNLVGRVEAANLFDLEQRLTRMGLDLIGGAPTAQKSRLFGAGRIARQDLINFCFHLEQLAKAGVPIVEGLVDLRDSVENPRFREVVSGLIESIEGGKNLSSAMGEFPEVFGKVFVSLVRSGEQTGKLAEVLLSLTESLKWEDELAAQTKKPRCIRLSSPHRGGHAFPVIYLGPQMTGCLRTWEGIPLRRASHSGVELFGNWWTLIVAPTWLVALRMAIKHPKVQSRRPRQGPRRSSGDLRKIILSRFASRFAMMYSSGTRCSTHPQLRGDRGKQAVGMRYAWTAADRRCKNDRASRPGAVPPRSPHDEYGESIARSKRPVKSATSIPRGKEASASCTDD